MIVNKYDVWLVNLNPTKGSEQQGIRPCLIFQNDIYTKIMDSTIIVIPITSTQRDLSVNTKIENFKEYGLSNISYIMCAQIRVLDKSRLIKKLGSISDKNKRNAIKEGVMKILDIEDEFINDEN